MDSIRNHLDNTFGPQYGHHFDFTLLFESAIFTILPTSILLAICPFHLFHYKSQPTRSGRSPLLYFKLMIGIVLLALEVTKTVIWNANPVYETVTSTVGNSLTCAASFCVIFMLAFEHRHAMQSSMPLSLYLSAVTLVNGIQARSQLMRPGLHIPAILTTATAVLNFLLVILLEIPKQLDAGTDSASNRNVNQESTGGFWNRTLVLWINWTLCSGFSKTIRMEDLNALGPDFSSERLSELFTETWAEADKTSKICLVRSTIKALWWPFVFPAIPRIAASVFQFSIPAVMRRILSYIENISKGGEVAKTYPPYTGPSLIILFAAVYQGVAFAKASHLHLKSRYLTLTRGMIASQILQKLLYLRCDSAQTSSALTLISTDVDGVVANIGQIHGVWIAIGECGFAIYFLYQEIGVACFLPIISILAAMLFARIFSKQMAPASKAWNESVEKRVSKTAMVLSNVKAIKMISLVSLVQTLLRGLRKAEIAQSIAARKIEVNKIGTLPLIFVFTPMITIAGALFWTTLADGLDSTNVFVLMSYLFLIYEPLVYLLNYIPTIGSVSACFARVQDFLLLQEHVDPRTMKPYDNSDVAATHGTAVVGSAFSEPATEACISLENTSVDSKVPDKPILQHVNIGIARSSIAMVIGPVASGKSTLLRAIIGESTPANGEIKIDGSSVAYASQSAWLPNDTIRQTILGSSAFESVWYSIVTWACELEEDIGRLAEGDHTIIGSNGSALSGGQRQRLALARAVYSRASILVLDDIISALDHTTASSIIVKLFGPEGLLKSQGRTVIMATHSVQYLSVADQVLTIDAEGNVVSEMGQSSLPDFEQASPTDADAEQMTTQELPAIPKEVKQLHNERGFYGSRNGDFSLYPFFLQDVSRSHLFGFFFLTALSTFLERSTPIYLSIWIRLDPTNKALLAGLGVIGLACIAVSMAKSRLYFIGIIPIISWSMHDMFLSTTLNATLPFLTSTGLGSLLSRAGQDVTLLGHELPMAFYRVVYMSGIVLTDTGVILASTRYAAIMLPIIIALIVIIQSFYLRTSRQIRNLELEAKTPLYEKISETMTGLDHIRCFGWTSKTINDSLSLLDDAQKPYYYLLSLQRWLGLVLDTSTTVVGTVIVSIAVLTPQNTSNHSLGLSLNALFAYSIGLMAFVEKWTTLETSLGAVARLRDFTTKTPVEKDGPDVQDQPENWGQTGRVELKNVTAQYKLDNKIHTALEGIKLTVEPGQKVVIKGRTGSGKSSLILTLLNFLDYSGTILIDGVDIKTVPRSQLRHCITTISQDIPLIPGSVRDNILPLDMLKPPGEEGKVNEGIVGHILECVGLWDHIDSRGGLDAPIEDMGFSAGQKQLLSLARGMLHHLEYDSMIVLMDEATSNMDFGTDAVMQGVMDAAFGDCTRFIISHRSLPMIDCSIYLEFADGKLIHEVDVAKWRVDDEISRRIRAERAANNGEGSWTAA